MARAPVSKTGGWGFESLHSCHPWTDPLIDRQSCPVGQFGVTPARRARRIPRRGAASVRA